MVDQVVGVSTSDFRRPELDRDVASKSVCGSSGYNFGPWPVAEDNVFSVGAEITVEVCVSPSAHGTHAFRFCENKHLVPKLWGRNAPSEPVKAQLEECFDKGQVPTYDPIDFDERAVESGICGNELRSVSRKFRLPTTPGRTVLSWRYLDFVNGMAFACADLNLIDRNATTQDIHHERDIVQGQPHGNTPPKNSLERTYRAAALVLIVAYVIFRCVGHMCRTKLKTDLNQSGATAILPISRTEAGTQMSPKNTSRAFAFQLPQDATQQFAASSQGTDCSSLASSQNEESPIRCRRQACLVQHDCVAA